VPQPAHRAACDAANNATCDDYERLSAYFSQEPPVVASAHELLWRIWPSHNVGARVRVSALGVSDAL
jgi:hypothetical protein